MTINFPHLYLEETESTNLVALALLSKTKPSNGFLIITDYQTAGKGQYGRKWQSERGKNLLFSLILSPLKLTVHELFRLHLSTSLALIRSLKNCGISQLSIKWPNDIYLSSKKLAGILIQNQLKGSIVEWSVIGIGVNGNQTHFPKEINATSILLETGIEINREKIVADIRSQIIDIISIDDKKEWDKLLEEYNSHLYLKDQMIAITTKDGNEFVGTMISVTKKGSLHIQKTDGQFSDFAFGEIQFKKG